MGTANNLDELRNHFHVLGLIGETWKTFERRRDYEAFLIKRKDSTCYMKKAAKLDLSQLAKKAAKIKINKKLDDIDTNSPFIQKKMEKGARMLAVAGVPKI